METRKGQPGGATAGYIPFSPHLLANHSHVIYPPRMTCAKRGCNAAPSASVALRYQEREVLVEDLHTDPDPNLLSLCAEHVQRMIPPRGWDVRDERTLVPASG